MDKCIYMLLHLCFCLTIHVNGQADNKQEKIADNIDYRPFALNLSFSNEYHGRVTIGYKINDDSSKRDTSTIKNGKCDFSGLINETTFLYLNFIDMPAPYNEYDRALIVSYGNNNLSIDTLGSLKNSIEGNANDSIYLIYHNTNKKLKNAIRERTIQTSKDSSVESLRILNILNDSLSIFRTQIIEEHSIYWVSAYLLNYYKDDLPPSILKELFVKLEADVKASFFGKEVENAVINQVGNPAADFESITAKNEFFKMADVTQSSSLTLVFFWATWCKPCKVMIPVLRKLHEQYNTKGLSVIGIADDDNKKALWLTYIDSLKLEFMTHFLMRRHRDGDIAKLYAVQAIPVVMIIDKNGIIVYRQVANDTDHLERFINEFYLKLQGAVANKL